ncbi:MAG: 50S ribosomal protein L4 [Patescibacteria group bacterium]|nr:50S ribosomal protein L4 [Patescibacteria group bacterium]
MKTEIINKKEKKPTQSLLPKEIFEVKFNSDLVHQVVVSQMANKRRSIAHTKDRSEVRGGGKKPWRQKGLGKARHGSIRSPIWIGGGITFGPRKDTIFKKRIPKRMKRLALFIVLSQKEKDKLLVVSDDLKFDSPKTKLMLEFINNLNLKKKSALIALPELDKNIILAARNIPNIKVVQAKDLNCLDLVSFKYLIIPKQSIKVIKETFLVKSKKQKTKDKK